MENKMITLEDLTNVANENYLKFLKEGQVKSILRNVGLFADHTIDNDILILTQNPNATCVKRLTEWNFYKRNIKKNEKAIKIISHHIYSNNLGGKEKDGKIYVDGIEKLKVEVGYVFDISQTEGKPFEYLNTNKETLAKFFDNTKKALEYTAKDYTFAYDDTTDNYSIDEENKVIHIKNGMTLDETTNALIKSVSQIALKSRHFNGVKSDDIAEIDDIELYGTIYAVNSRLGLELPEYDFDNIQNWTDDNLALFKTNLQKIRSVSKQIIANVESSIEYAIRSLNREKTKQKETIENSSENKEEKIEEKEELKETKPKRTKKKQAESEVE